MISAFAVIAIVGVINDKATLKPMPNMNEKVVKGLSKLRKNFKADAYMEACLQPRFSDVDFTEKSNLEEIVASGDGDEQPSFTDVYSIHCETHVLRMYHD